MRNPPFPGHALKHGAATRHGLQGQQGTPGIQLGVTWGMSVRNAFMLRPNYICQFVFGVRSRVMVGHGHKECSSSPRTSMSEDI